MPPELVGIDAAVAALGARRLPARRVRPKAKPQIGSALRLLIHATELVIVAVYTPGAKFAGTTIEIVGDQVEVLIPVLAPVTTVTTPVRSVTGYAVATTGPESTIGPAE